MTLSDSDKTSKNTRSFNGTIDIFKCIKPYLFVAGIVASATIFLLSAITLAQSTAEKANTRVDGIEVDIKEIKRTQEKTIDKIDKLTDWIIREKSDNR